MNGLHLNDILYGFGDGVQNCPMALISLSSVTTSPQLGISLNLHEAVFKLFLNKPHWSCKKALNRANYNRVFSEMRSASCVIGINARTHTYASCVQLNSHGLKSVLVNHNHWRKWRFASQLCNSVALTIPNRMNHFRIKVKDYFRISQGLTLNNSSPFSSKKTLNLKGTLNRRSAQMTKISGSRCRNLYQKTHSPPIPILRGPSTLPPRSILCNKRSDLTIIISESISNCKLILSNKNRCGFLIDAQLSQIFYEFSWGLLHSLEKIIKKSATQENEAKIIKSDWLLPEFQALHQQTASSRGSHLGGGGGGGFPRSSHPHHQSATASSVARVFNKYDVLETSYHLYSERIDLHFCDDPGPGRSTHPDLSSGAALQMTVSQLEVDYYPYHLAAGDRNHWVKYNVDCGPAQWAMKALNQFKTQLIDTLNASRSSHTPLARAPPHLKQENLQTQGGQGRHSAPSSGNSPVKGVVAGQLRKLMSSTAVLRINDFSIFRVSTPKRKQAPKEFMSGDKDRFSLPTQMQCIHAEFTLYYNPGDSDFPVPPQKVYLQVNPIQITLDPLSILWLNSFGRNLQRSIIKESQTPSYIDVYMEAIMPRVIVEGVGEHMNQRDRPRSMHIQASRVIISNVRGCDPTSPGSLSSLATCLEAAQQGELFFASDFPATQLDYQPICEKFLNHVTAADNVKKHPVIETDSIYEAIASMKRDSLWTQARDVLFLHCEPMWIDFMGVPAARNRPVPFVDAFPVSVWMYIKPKAALTVNNIDNTMENTSLNDYDKSNCVGESYSSLSADYKAKCDLGSVRNEAAIHMLVHTPSLVSVQLNHYQYLFLMRQLDVLNELTAFLTADTNYIFTHPKFPELSSAELGDSVAIAAVIPQVDVSIIMPPLHPCKDSLGGDMESFVPDSSSTADLGELGTPPYELRNSASEHSLAHRPNMETDTSSAATGDILKSHSVDELAVGISASSDTTDTCLPDSMLPPATANGNITHSTTANNTTTREQQHQQQPNRMSNSLTNVNKPISTITDEFGNQVMQLNLHDNFNAGFSTMRKGLSSGLTNFMSTLESAVKNSPEDMSDTMSIRSDLSSDSDNFIMVNMESERANSQLGGVDALFRIENKPPPTSIEMASEVFEESTPSDVSEITSSCKRKDSVSI
ncbi:unnamed protein product, partial [Meganyctiphanes norvegica]